MIEIKDKKDCCGCHACATVCPKHCIAMCVDEEGFLYPSVRIDACVKCGLCEQVCPVIHQAHSRLPLKVYASMSKILKIRMRSSSGGLFTLLAETVIKQGGIVFGAKFDEDWNVVHAWTDTMEGITAFQGSKYVQSVIGTTFREAKTFLQQGRKVLFSGTPCQIAGLKRYLRKEYPQLLTVDIVCHGVPSPAVWQCYLNSLKDRMEKITRVSMRDKTEGWNHYRMEIHAGKRALYSGRAACNDYSRGYLANLFLRPSCHSCPARQGKSQSDITLGDFWGIHRFYPMFDDHKGTGLVLINTQAGMNHYRQIDVYQIETTYQQGLMENPCLEKSVPYTRLRKEFWLRFPTEGVGAIVRLYKKKNHLLYRLWNRLCNIIQT